MVSIPTEIKVPRNHWNQLSAEDQNTFRQLHLHFLQQQKDHLKERRTNSFFNDIIRLLKYIDYSTIGRDDRAICVGLAFAGPFVCVNTQQLKTMLSRCKSSINNSFQQIGYDAIKNKTKTREAVLSIIPSLMAETNSIRKWKVRCASKTTICCFYSNFRVGNLPHINDCDLYDEKKSVQDSMVSTYSSANSSLNYPTKTPIQKFSSEMMSSNIPIQEIPPYQTTPMTMHSMFPSSSTFHSQSNVQFSSNFIDSSLMTSNPNTQILPPMNFGPNSFTSQSKSKVKILEPLNFHKGFAPIKSDTDSSIGEEFGFQKVNVEHHQPFLAHHASSHTFLSNTDKIDSQQNLTQSANKRKTQFDLSIFSDEDIPIPDITPSFSLNHLDELHDDSSLFFDDTDSFDSIQSTNITFNFPRSKSAFIPSHDFPNW